MGLLYSLRDAIHNLSSCATFSLSPLGGRGQGEGARVVSKHSSVSQRSGCQLSDLAPAVFRPSFSLLASINALVFARFALLGGSPYSAERPNPPPPIYPWLQPGAVRLPEFLNGLINPWLQPGGGPDQENIATVLTVSPAALPGRRPNPPPPINPWLQPGGGPVRESITTVLTVSSAIRQLWFDLYLAGIPAALPNP